MTETLKKDTTDQTIRRVVVENPGIRLYELSRKTNVPYSTCRYRLLDMERYGAIRIEVERGIVRAYPAKEAMNDGMQ
jgi:predicted transcriptional regulator